MYALLHGSTAAGNDFPWLEISSVVLRRQGHPYWTAWTSATEIRPTPRTTWSKDNQELPVTEVRESRVGEES
jgi:hypothetical protein